MPPTVPQPPKPLSEAAVQAQVRLAASDRGGRLWRNNLGVATDLRTGRVIRYGLANESARVNQRMKSSDLIGITPIMITQDMVGQIVGVFTAIECKREGWTYQGTPTEVAQKRFIDLVGGLGGLARFSTGTL